MNYRHSFHAGNFADILKHLIFIAAIKRMNENSESYNILDLYAGRGLYDLKDFDARKTNEYLHGIDVLYKYYKSQSETSGHLIPQLMQIIANVNKKNAIRYYPGSPLIAANMIADRCRLQCSELHPQEFKYLSKNLKPYKARAYNVSAEDMLNRSLSLLKQDSLILIDPAFEVLDEFSRIIDLCKMIEANAETNTVLIWYPIKNIKSVQQYTSGLKSMRFDELLRVTISIPKQFVKKSYNGDDGLYQCGVDIINPGPLAQDIKDTMKILEEVYTPSAKIMMTTL